MTAPPPTPQRPAAPSDAVTAFRRELKYAFGSFDFDRILARLDSTCEPIRFAPAVVSSVSSIYFDDDRLTSVWESMSGVGNRIKLRLRWYDAPMPAGHAVFEVKRRRGAAVFKDRTAIDMRSCAAPASFAQMLLNMDGQLSPLAHALISQRRTPTALIRYDRRHYREPFSGARLTVDYNIRGYDQLGRMSPSLDFPVALHERVVVELKVSPGQELVAARRLGALLTRPCRSSKLVLCCARFGWKLLPDRHD